MSHSLPKTNIIPQEILLPPEQNSRIISKKIFSQEKNEIGSLHVIFFSSYISVWCCKLKLINQPFDLEMPYFRTHDQEHLYYGFIKSQNKEATFLDTGIPLRNGSLLFFNSLKKEKILFPSCFEGEIIQLILDKSFLLKNVLNKYSKNSQVNDVIHYKTSDWKTFEKIPSYLKNKILSIGEQLIVPSGENANRLLLLGETIQFLDTFFRVYLNEAPLSYEFKDDNEFEQLLISYFKRSLFDPFMGIETAAKHFNMSPSTFKKRFSKIFATTPLHFVQQLQMEEAKKAIYKSEQISHVAYIFGFSSASNFIRCFKRHFGYTPGGL